MECNAENWRDAWFPYVEETARKEGSYRYPLAQKQDSTVGNGFWSDVEFKDGLWWQTLYDANADHVIVKTKSYEHYVDAVDDFSIYPNPETAGFAYQASLY